MDASSESISPRSGGLLQHPIDGGLPELTEKNEPPRKHVGLHDAFGHPHELEHRAEAPREKDPGIAQIPKAAQALGKVGNGDRVADPSVGSAALEDDAHGAGPLVCGAAADRLHHAAVPAADHPALPFRNLTAQPASVFVRRLSLPGAAGAKDADGNQDELSVFSCQFSVLSREDRGAELTTEN